MSNEWNEIKLGEAMTLKRGFDITQSEQTTGSIPVVSSSGIQSYHNQTKCKGPGVITGRKGTLGLIHYVENDYWPHDTTLWVCDFKKNHPRFIYYYLQTLKLETFDSGASNPTLNRNHIHQLKTNFPSSRETQKEIAAILSAYDEFIENNNKRIALLEQVAEQIYKEWFVRMRFPGYENAEFEMGVPKGWGLEKLFDALYVDYGYPFQSDLFNEEDNGIPVIRIRDLIDGNSKTCTTEIVNEKYLVSNGDILVGMDGDFHYSKWANGRAWLNQRNLRFRAKMSHLGQYFIYHSTKPQIEFLNEIIVGTTVSHLSDKDLRKLKLLMPTEKLLIRFNEIVEPIYQQEIILKQQNRNLKQTRDLLLPRLISGKLLVKDLETVPKREKILTDGS